MMPSIITTKAVVMMMERKEVSDVHTRTVPGTVPVPGTGTPGYEYLVPYGMAKLHQLLSGT